MRTITLSIPDSMSFDSRSWQADVPTGNWSETFLLWCVKRGIEETLSNAFGANGADATEAEKTAKLGEKVDQLARGEIPAGGGGRKADPVERAARDTLVAMLVQAGKFRTKAQATKAIREKGTARRFIEAGGGDAKALYQSAAEYVERERKAQEALAGLKLDFGS